MLRSKFANKGTTHGMVRVPCSNQQVAVFRDISNRGCVETAYTEK
jgi:hypothetical protein